MALFVAAVLTTVFVAIGIWAGGKVAKFSGQRRVTDLEMWRLGAEGGPTVRDREIARRRLAYETHMWQVFDVLGPCSFGLWAAHLGLLPDGRLLEVWES